MKSSALPLLAAVSGLGILGCTAIPQAGLIYSSTVIAGVGMKVSTADATSPIDISIGFKTHDFAYVPVAVVEAKDVNKGEIVKVWGSHGQNTAESNDCAAALKQYPSVLGTTATKEDKDKVNAACDNKRDAMSVYGQFNGSGDASAKDQRAGLMVGRIFSTGIAAQNVSLAAKNVGLTECSKAIADLHPIPVSPPATTADVDTAKAARTAAIVKRCL